jgi:hypothetical protein
LLGEHLIKNVNEGKRTPQFGRNLKAIGMRPGLLDYQFIVPNDKFHSLWLEFKRVDGRNKAKDPLQEEWIAKLNKNGHYAIYAYGADDAIHIYQDYINNRI